MLYDDLHTYLTLSDKATFEDGPFKIIQRALRKCLRVMHFAPCYKICDYETLLERLQEIHPNLERDNEVTKHLPHTSFWVLVQSKDTTAALFFLPWDQESNPLNVKPLYALCELRVNPESNNINTAFMVAPPVYVYEQADGTVSYQALKVQESLSDEEVSEDANSVLVGAIALLGIMSLCRRHVVQIETPTKLQKKRRKQSKRPNVIYRILQLDAGAIETLPQTQRKQVKYYCPKATHFRRGHWRRYRDKETQEVKHKIFINEMIINKDKYDEYGLVIKDYNIVKTIKD